MENALRSTHRPKFLFMPAIFSIIYTFGTFGFICLWFGIQYIPGFAGFEKYGLVYSIVCLLGAASNIAIMRGHRRGVIGQICIWVANSAINVFLRREIEPFLGLAVLFIVLWSLEIYRNRQSLN